jgi:hypothetical protein
MIMHNPVGRVAKFGRAFVATSTFLKLGVFIWGLAERRACIVV